ncbi:VWFA and cache domain-containing protein 1-like isoform X2 [Mytilus californianus]|uniref:VWFA and cache domain-containing protein 1-like isoform X2 n=1 Tax=Mytilus californianus TaxID=6549 RepID=UPI002245BBAC|nr:VWFA and cache domain-containing protein 1-like isoform X2 [Mytilus californianus]
MDLPSCCDLLDNDLTFALKFQTKVDFNQACVTTSPIKTDNLKYPTKEISAIMKKDYQNNRNVLWQHYSTTEGVFVLYPATKLTNCDNFDPRFTTPYASTASPSDKDVVIVIDTSASMKQSSAVTPKTKIVIAKEAANNVIQTLKPNDRVGLVTFNQDAFSPSGNSYHSCYQSEMAFATKENTDKLKGYVFSIGTGSSVSNFGKALVAAFKFFNSSDDTIKVQNRDQVILFISDGKSTSGSDPVQVISTENSKLQNKITIFTYLIGQDEQAKIQLQNMSSQTLHDPSFGPKQIGHFEYFDFAESKQKLLSVKLATFYEHLPIDGQSDQSTFTSPYVDPFSKIGLITSLCRTVKVAAGFHGVICTDVKISELLTEIEYFSEEEYSYGFMIDGTGRVLMHPLLPNAAFVRSTEDPVLVDISVLERAPEAQSVIDSMKSGESGSKEFNKFFIKPRGKLLNDGSKDVNLKAQLFWGPIPKSNFSLCIVLVEESYSEIDESKFNTDKSNVFMFHDRNLLKDDFKNCKFYRRRATLAHSSVKFTPTAFQNPFQFLDSDETALNVTKYKNYITATTSSNPGFKSTVRSSVWATYKAEQFWKEHPATYVSWRYIGTKSGVMRTYPGILLHKNFDHEKRPWWRQALGHPNTMYLTTPYVDGWGSGIVLTFIHTLHKAGTDGIGAVTATVAADFPLQYFNWFINDIYPSCDDGNRCIILDNSGFIVMHPRLKDTTDESDFLEPKHITVEEPGIAEMLTSKGVLNSKECQDFSVNTNLRSYRVTMPSGFSGGLDLKDTENNFEIRPVTDSNLFIIRFQSRPSTECTSICQGSKSPDVFECQDNCDCLCHIPITYDVCSNRYNTESAPSPCSARIPDTSGKNDPDITDGLDACYTPTCHEKSSKQECYSEAECTWCEYTDIGQQIATPCCRLKEDCYFGKTTPENRDTCAPISTQAPAESGGEGAKTGWIVGGSVVAGIILTLVVFGGVKYFRNCEREDQTDPYIDAVPDRGELPQYTEREECTGEESPQRFYDRANQNFYCQPNT